MEKFEEFWIIHFSGPPLFFYSVDTKFDPNLVAGFFSAIQMFAKNMSVDNGLNSLTIGQNTFTFLTSEQYKLYFIAKSKKKVKEKRIIKKMEDIRQRFITQYKKPLENLEMNYSGFEDFTETFESVFTDNFEKLDGLW